MTNSTRAAIYTLIGVAAGLASGPVCAMSVRMTAPDVPAVFVWLPAILLSLVGAVVGGWLAKPRDLGPLDLNEYESAIRTARKVRRMTSRQDPDAYDREYMNPDDYIDEDDSRAYIRQPTPEPPPDAGYPPPHAAPGPQRGAGQHPPPGGPGGPGGSGGPGGRGGPGGPMFDHNGEPIFTARPANEDDPYARYTRQDFADDQMYATVGYESEQYVSYARMYSPTRTSRMSRQAALTLLGLESGASVAQIRASFRSKAAQCHPDRVAHQGEQAIREATQRFRALKEAYDRLRGR